MVKQDKKEEIFVMHKIPTFTIKNRQVNVKGWEKIEYENAKPEN